MCIVYWNLKLRIHINNRHLNLYNVLTRIVVINFTVLLMFVVLKGDSCFFLKNTIKGSCLMPLFSFMESLFVVVTI